MADGRLFGHVAVIGGAGYVGSVLVPRLLERGYIVTVVDLFWFGDHLPKSGRSEERLRRVKGDIRDYARLALALKGVEAVIHLACISNDPSFELNPRLGKSINYDAFPGLVTASKANGVRRFVYASSSSVYGVKDTENVTEDLPLEPLTDYSKYKALCEEVLMKERERGFATLILRPATVCGYSPRLRLDLTVNILTNHAANNNKITVFGGQQMRPNIHIDDVVDLYVRTLEWPDEAIDGEIFNAGYENLPVMEIAQKVRSVVGERVEIITTPTDDNRSYHVSSEKIKRELGFAPKRTIEDAVRGLVAAFRDGKIPNPMTDIRYYNIKTMQALHLR